MCRHFASFAVCSFVLISILVLANSPAQAQQDPLQIRGSIPWGSYQDSQIDTINLMNGSPAFHIPLYSLPQRGQLSLSFSLQGTAPAYGFGTYTCTANNGLGPCYIGGFSWNTYGDGFNASNMLRPVLDQALWASFAQIRYPANSNTFYNVYGILDSRGSLHELGYDNSNPQLLRSTDGTALLYSPTPDPPYSPYSTDYGNGTIYTPGGIQHVHSSSAYTIKDSDGNSIAMAMNCCFITQITDSLGRTMPPPPTGAASTSTTGCPAVTALYQATTGSSTWIVPGPGGSQLTYLFCYTSIYSHTDFFGGCINNQPQGSCPGNYDSYGTNTNVLQAVVLPNGTYYLFTYAAANPSDNTSYGYADLTQIRLPSGGTINYQYANLPSTCTTAFNCANRGGGVNAARGISNRVFDPGSGGQQASWTYAYTDYNSNTATVTDFQGNDTVLTFSNLGSGCANISVPAPYETQQQVFQGSHTNGRILSTKTTTYQVTCPNPQSGTWRGFGSIIAVLPTQVQTTLDNGLVTTTTHQYNDGGFADVQPACTAGSNNTFSCTWSPTQQVPFGLKTSTSVTDYSGTTLKTVQTQYLYQQTSSYFPGNFLNQTASVTTLNGSGTQVAKTTYGYDENNGSPQGIFAHQTSVNRWLNITNTYLTSKSVYNTQGMLTQTIDPLLNATTYTYDSTGAFLSQIQYPATSGIAHIEHFSIDPNTGLTTSYTDQNGQVTSTQYDNMRRATRVNYPDTGQTTNCYTDTGGPTCTQTAPPYAVVTTRKMNSTQNETITTLFDGLGRVTQTQLNSDPDCLSGDKTDTTYDALGHVATVSNPYCTTSDSTYGLTSYAYDALGRTTQVTHHPDNSTVLTTYTGRATQVQDESNGTQRVTRISQIDGLGRLVSVCEVSSASLIGSGGTPAACGQDIAATGFLTSYQYDALDNLTAASMSGLNPRTFAYDSLSRLTSANNPESGTTTYAYDNSGNVITKTDARGITTCFGDWTGTTCNGSTGYDALNRVLKKTYSDGTPAANFNYDQSSALGVTLINTVGRKSSESTAGPNATGSVFSYDTMGRISNNSQCTPQNCGTAVFGFQYTQYNFVGDLISATNATGTTFSYVYNGAARLTAISTNFVDGSHPGSLFSNARYAPFGGLTSATLGNGVTESWSYNNRLWQQSRTATFGATTPYSFSVPTFAPNGDILAANDSVNGNWTYTYDAFNRLASANATGQAYTYEYDRFGNRWHQNGPQSSQLGFDANNHITGVTGVGYDLAGNLTSDGSGSGSHTYFYDAESRIIQVDGTLGTCSTAAACYVYNAEGQRVRKTTGGSSIDYLYDLAGHKVADVDPTGVFMQGELYAGDRHFAIYAPEPGPTGATFFTHSDWLGTERVRTDMTGTNCESIASLPFGDGQSITGTCGDVSPLHFTGKERDSESGLDNFEARYMSSSMGRLMSPDLLGGHQEDPQTLNRYVYARNNPLNFVDPTGLDFNLTCSTKENTPTCQNGLQGTTTTTTDANGNQVSKFTPTVISNDKNGNLVDQNGNQYNATVSGAGVSFSQAGSNQPGSLGVFINGSNPTTVQDAGNFPGFTFNFTYSNMASGVNAGGTFKYSGNYGDAEAALLNAGFQAYPGDAFDPFHLSSYGNAAVDFRSPGAAGTGAGSGHFTVYEPRIILEHGMIIHLTWTTPTRGTLHLGEHNVYNGGLIDHTIEVLKYLFHR